MIALDNNHKRMNIFQHSMRSACALLMIAFMNQSGFAHVDSLEVAGPPIPTPRFRSIQADYVTLFFINAASLSVDFDLKQLRISKSKAFFGARVGIEQIESFSFDGEEDGSPFIDCNLLARLSTSGNSSRIDVYAGYTYRKSSTEHSYQNHIATAGLFKIGFDLKWMFIEKFFGLMVKFNVVRGRHDKRGSIGFGFVLALDQ